MSACSDKLLLIQAFLDGELDAANSISLEAHLRSCPMCREELARMEAVRAKLSTPGLVWRAPPELRRQVERQIEEASPASMLAAASPASRRYGRLAAIATSLAAAFALVLVVPQFLYHDTQDELVASHVRSLLATHLTDVPNSDRHIVKPWFNGRIDFVPPVPELKEQGYPLAGGRLDYVEGKVIAAIVYHRRLHPINLFVRRAPPTALPFATTSQQEGYNIVRWRANGLEYWAVSDLNAKELDAFRTLYENAH